MIWIDEVAYQAVRARRLDHFQEGERVEKDGIPGRLIDLDDELVGQLAHVDPDPNEAIRSLLGLPRFTH